MDIDKLEAGRELDALIAKEIMRLNVLGVSNVHRDPECCCGQHWMIPFDYYAEANAPGAFARYVYLKECFCDHRDESDVDYFGHIASCLEVVLPYSTIDAAIWKLVAELDSRGFVICLLDHLGYEELDGGRLVSMWRCEFLDEGAHAADRPRNEIWKGIAQAGTASLAMCRAALKI